MKIDEPDPPLNHRLNRPKCFDDGQAKALNLFTAAADAGLLAAQYNLAMMHTAGLAHTKDYNADEDRPRAYKWFMVVLARLDPSVDRSPINSALELLREEMTSSD